MEDHNKQHCRQAHSRQSLVGESADPSLRERSARGSPGLSALGSVTWARFRSGPEVFNDDSDLQVACDATHTIGGLRTGIAFAEGGPLKIATVASVPTPGAEVAARRALLCARVASDYKAQNVVVLDMRGLTPLYDFLVLATGTSRRQIHTLAEEIDAVMAGDGETRLGIEGYASAKWVVQDYGDTVVHLFDPETRSYYGLDDLWADASPLDWEQL